MLSYLSKTLGIGGKVSGRDFVVEEIMSDGTVLEIGKNFCRKGEGEFTHFVLEKRGWATFDAIGEIAKKLRVSRKRFSCAGMKDRDALTTQLASAYGVEPKKLLSLRGIRDIRINGAWRAKEKVKMGELAGNRFKVVVRGVARDSEKRIKKILGELRCAVPNYFGEQRFGSMRGNTHLVGSEILNGNFPGAVWNYLTFVGKGRESADAKAARMKLRKEKEFAKALEYFPHYLRYERLLLAHLSKHPNDCVGALRKLPRGLCLMFVHAYQSHIFNEVLSAKVKEGFRALKGKGNVIGYETKSLCIKERKLLKKYGITRENFRIKSFPEISSGGTKRLLLAPMRDFEFKVLGSNVELSFALPAGAYATAALREFLDKRKRGSYA